MLPGLGGGTASAMVRSFVTQSEICPPSREAKDVARSCWANFSWTNASHHCEFSLYYTILYLYSNILDAGFAFLPVKI